MMYSQNRAARYQSVRSHGLVTDANGPRLVQIVYEQVLTELATAQGSMERIKDHRPLNEVVIKCSAIKKAVRLIGHLDATLNMEKGGEVAVNLRNLYLFMLQRLTFANAENDVVAINDVIKLVRTVKSGWDDLVANQT